MTGESNKGRFKCADEAQAAWNAFKGQTANFWNVKKFETDGLYGVLAFEYFSKSLHNARLIHGSIYDEDGRIEDKDVAHLVFLSYERFGFGMKESDFYEFVNRMIKKGKIRGTIFYE